METSPQRYLMIKDLKVILKSTNNKDIPQLLSHIYFVTYLLWKDREPSYDEMSDLYALCIEFGLPLTATSVIVRNVVVGIHSKQSIFDIFDNLKKLNILS